jgi:eukaryotic-like serine/threonine-protein kinase
MPLVPGTRLGPYEILAHIGAGGMGEVYKALDTRLDRTVAVKVLLPHVAGDPLFRERFEREARAVSALDHPHICALYDVGHEQSMQFLVLQYLEGETLADRLAKGSLPLDQALERAREIADALDKAHRAGIVHRDLKPGNVMLTRTGAKLLDFGLAKAASVGRDIAVAETMTAAGPLTAEGTILGTQRYMAPELLEGRAADARSDIWAFGCLLYEMVAGRRPFESQSQASLVAAILEHDPAPVSTVATLAPVALDHLIERCLAKDPDERWASVHDVLLELTWIAEGGATTAQTATPPRSRERLLAALLAIASMAAVGIAIVHVRERPSPPVRGVFDTRLPADLHLMSALLALSPDGRSVAFVAEKAGVRRLFLRPLNSSEVTPLEGTSGASATFWSPDGSAIGFVASGKIKRIALGGSPPVDVCDAPGAESGSWNSAGTIIFASRGAIHRVAAGGGTPERITTDGEYAAPVFLADGRRFLARGPDAGVYAGALDQPTMVKVLEGAHGQIAFAAGHLLFNRGGWFTRVGSLFAQPFDEESLKPTGTPVPVVDDLVGPKFSAQGGILVYAGGRAPNRLRWVARSGAPLGYAGEPGAHTQIAIAPGETKVVLATDGHLWLLDFATNVVSQLTNGPGNESDPTWSQDERRIAFTARRNGPPTILQKPTIFQKDLITGIEQPLVLDPPPLGAVVDDWSADGRWLIFRHIGSGVFALPMAGERKPRLIAEMHGADSVHLSPSGRWMAFTDTTSGRAEVSIVSFPGFTDKRQVSRGGGMQPIWRRDGKELFYLGANATIYAVSIQESVSLTPGAPVPLFETRIRPDSNWDQYGVVDNGQRFLVLEAEQPGESLTFVLDWPARMRPR